jgi:hypothetical protein
MKNFIKRATSGRSFKLLVVFEKPNIDRSSFEEQKFLFVCSALEYREWKIEKLFNIHIKILQGIACAGNDFHKEFLFHCAVKIFL